MIVMKSVPNRMDHKAAGQPCGYWEIDAGSKTVRVGDAAMEALIGQFERRDERIADNYGPIEERCTTMDGEELVFSLTGAEVKALIGHVRA